MEKDVASARKDNRVLADMVCSRDDMDNCVSPSDMVCSLDDMVCSRDDMDNCVSQSDMVCSRADIKIISALNSSDHERIRQ